MKRLATVILIPLFVAGCAAAPRGTKSENNEGARPGLSEVRMCSQEVPYTLHAPPADMPAEKAGLYGIWKGEIRFDTGSGMCIGLVVQKIDGDVANTVWVWNVSEGGKMDINNISSMGVTAWDGAVKDGEIMLVPEFPWHGNWYSIAFRQDGPNRLAGTWYVLSAAGGQALIQRKGDAYGAYLDRQ